MGERNDISATKGVLAAVAIMSFWTLSLGTLLTIDLGLSDVWWIPLAVLAQTFLQTGLFITAHDSMHGTVAPGRRRLNDFLGGLAVRLYALFSLKKLRRQHARHHNHPARPGEDPDYHDGQHSDPFRWYFNFVGNYVGLWQIVGMAVVFNVLEHVVGLSAVNLVVFWVVPALLSTVQLFYFGTYLPHRSPHQQDDPHRARSNEYPPWLSFVTCYHFGYHREHHERPDLPWWRLPSFRSRRNEAIDS